MSAQKPCIRCERAIDEWAKICPYCNWDQGQPAPVREATPAAEIAAYVPPAETNLKRKAMFAGAGVLLLIVSFAIGMFINRDGAPKNAPEAISEQAQRPEDVVAPVKRADTPLVPTNEPGGIDQPITSAPVVDPTVANGTAPTDWQRSDATAASSVEYAQLAKRAQLEKKKMAAVVDPRTLTGAAYAQGAPPQTAPAPPRRATPARSTVADTRESSRSIRTRPVPEYQPVPPFRGRGSARFDLVVGADGRVKDITVRQAVDGNTAQLVSAVQSWRFKPATENGHPVSAPFRVEIRFGGQ